MSEDRIDFAAGVISSILTTVIAPFERAKILYQTQSANPRIAPDSKYKGVIHCFTSILKQEGFHALWRGNLPALLRAFPRSTADDLFRNPFPQLQSSPYWMSLVSFSAIESFFLLCIYPLDVARTRLAVDVGKSAIERQFKGSIDCLTHIFKSDGVRGLYRGFGPALLEIIAYKVLNEGGTHFTLGSIFKEKSSLRETFLTGYIIMLGALGITYPLDTVSRMLMMQSGTTDTTFTGMVDCFQKVYKKEGVRGFYRGIVFRAGLYIVPGLAMGSLLRKYTYTTDTL